MSVLHPNTQPTSKDAPAAIDTRDPSPPAGLLSRWAAGSPTTMLVSALAAGLVIGWIVKRQTR